MDSRIHREVYVRFGGEGANVPLAYGTGIVGANSPHPEPQEGWKYDVNTHGMAGWQYFDEKQNRVRWTRGQKANAFVYKTAEFLRKQSKNGVVIRING